jgi:hypothetical protein
MLVETAHERNEQIPALIYQSMVYFMADYSSGNSGRSSGDEKERSASSPASRGRESRALIDVSSPESSVPEPAVSATTTDTPPSLSHEELDEMSASSERLHAFKLEVIPNAHSSELLEIELDQVTSNLQLSDDDEIEDSMEADLEYYPQEDHDESRRFALAREPVSDSLRV